MENAQDYLEAEGYIVKSPRETLKVAFQMEIMKEGHIWLDALASRNLAAQSYDEVLAENLVDEIQQRYLSELHQLYEKLAKNTYKLQ